MGHLPKNLDGKILNRLNKKGRIICFNYFDPWVSEKIKNSCSGEEAQFLIKYDGSPEETSHAIINRDLYAKVYYNKKRKICKINSIKIYKNKIIIDNFSIPKGSEYILVKRNFQKKNTSF